ncbi:MAG TPA: (Fe-S)-binding protein [Candidatus Nanopelagicales bacterium]|nr:(Fe-S)-binding protein [Candidatus Nanopelagicales bacterium]
MGITIFGLLALFAWSAKRRWGLLMVGRPEGRFDHLAERLKGVWVYAFRQKKMGYYPLAGLAHKLIFVGFLVLLLRSIMLWGRGFDPGFNLWILGPEPLHLPGGFELPLGHIYELTKDVVALLVIAGALVFIYYRAVKKLPRMTLSGEGLLILGIIITMMVSDILYDGASMVLYHRHAGPGMSESVATIVAPHMEVARDPSAIGWHIWPSPAGSLAATLLAGVGASALVVIAHAGFWTHATLVLVFLNLLPYSKHFHIITAIPNVLTRDLEPRGRLPKVADNAEAIGEMVMKAAEEPEKAEPVGIARIEQFTWKAILDFYTCTECGRCTDNCPAHKTGKILSPKQFTLNLRDHLYSREKEFLAASSAKPNGAVEPEKKEGEGAEAAEGAEGAEAAAESPTNGANGGVRHLDLVSDVIHPDVLWACTTCRACEEQCPVMISYVDKIVSMRRNLVLVKGEIPNELAGPFQAMEVNGNPWNMARLDRAGWADGLGIPMMADKPDAQVLFWVGCAASYDDRAKKIARATARLLQAAKVDFAILGQEETCTGDPARRAGNEYLFAMLAEQNAGTLNGYKEQGGIKQIVTTCPHCFNTLLNEYPDFGAKFEVVHHTDYLLKLVAEKKITPTKKIDEKVVFHDSCYLGRYNDVYEQPRDVLEAIPGVSLVEVEGWSRSKGLCCGAGGAQFWMEEQNKDRVNVKRTLQLIQTEAKTIATACPFCQTMITDGLKAHGKEDEVRQLDVAELLAESALEKPARPKPAEEATSSDEASAA